MITASGIMAALVWGAPQWLWPAVIIGAVALLVTVFAYGRTLTTPSLRLIGGALKVTAVVLLLICLLEPLFSGTRPRPGSNLFIVMADNSKSMQIRDGGRRRSRGDVITKELVDRKQWQTRLSQDFDVRWYRFDGRLRSTSGFEGLDYDGDESAIGTVLSSISQRYRNRPVAGVLLVTDGIATDLKKEIQDWSELPPIYPVIVGDDKDPRDIRVEQVTVNQTNFEASPVVLKADISSFGSDGKPISVQVTDEKGKLLQEQIIRNVPDNEPRTVRFEMRPEEPGVHFYQVRAIADDEKDAFADESRTDEPTLANNNQMVTVDRGGGPYRILYVAGRPNWEFKFLRRAVEDDQEVRLVGLVRVAKREPKFDFRSRENESTNPLYRGFGNKDDEDAEQYNQPVMLRLGTRDEIELRDGFPKARNELFKYHAVIMDDVESGFFTRDQLSLLQEFVSQRGGGLLMLGGQESFTAGKYSRTPIGEMLPVYLDRSTELAPDERFRFALSREGRLEPWVRLRSTNDLETQRLARMPEFHHAHTLSAIKPGATVMAYVRARNGDRWPALVTHRFGEGRVAALMVADMWRWGLRRRESEKRDLDAAWRQTVRWLVADISQRVEVEVQRADDKPGQPVTLQIKARDELFEPLDNAEVRVTVISADDEEPLEVAANPTNQSGVYEAVFVPRTAGAYRASVKVTSPDGSMAGERETGWTAQPARREFQQLRPDREFLEDLAKQTGGEVIAANKVDGFVADLPNRKIPITEPWIYPLWHHWGVLTLVVICLVGEWGVRRLRGLP